jgi:hypothetical protein
MAVIDNGYLRGQIGNVVNRKVGAQNIVQTKPTGKIRQTECTQAAATDFGTASAAGSLIRRAFNSLHLKLHDHGMHTRLVKRMQRVLRGNGKTMKGHMQIKNGNIKRLVDFQFNENCHLHDYLYFDPEVTLDERGRISIQLPAIKTSSNFYLPKRCSHIVVEFDIKGFNFSRKCFQSIGSYEIELPLYGKDRQEENEQTLEFNILDEPFDSVLVVLSIRYLYKDGTHTYLRNSETLNPVGIIAAFNPKKNT